MPTPVILPKLGMTMVEGTITEWYQQSGDAVQTGDLLFAFETEKVNYDVQAEAEGRLHILVAATETVDAGAVVAQILAAGEEPAPVAAPAAAPTPAAARARPMPLPIPRAVQPAAPRAEPDAPPPPSSDWPPRTAWTWRRSAAAARAAASCGRTSRRRRQRQQRPRRRRAP